MSSTDLSGLRRGRGFNPGHHSSAPTRQLTDFEAIPKFIHGSTRSPSITAGTACVKGVVRVPSRLNRSDQPRDWEQEGADRTGISRISHLLRTTVLEDKELRQRILAAVESLPYDYREVVVLREMQGMSYNEIADATKLSLDNVKTRLSAPEQCSAGSWSTTTGIYRCLITYPVNQSSPVTECVLKLAQEFNASPVTNRGVTGDYNVFFLNRKLFAYMRLLTMLSVVTILFACPPANSQEQGAKISDIIVVGNKSLNKEGIIATSGLKIGDAASPVALEEATTAPPAEWQLWHAQKRSERRRYRKVFSRKRKRQGRHRRG